MSFDLGDGLLVGIGGAGNWVSLSTYDPGSGLPIAEPNNAFGFGQNIEVIQGGFAFGFDATVRNAILVGSGSATGTFGGYDVTGPSVFGFGKVEVAGSNSMAIGFDVQSTGLRTVEIGVWNKPDEQTRLRDAATRYVGSVGEGGLGGIVSHTLTLSDLPVQPYVSGPEQMRLLPGMWTLCTDQNGNLRIDYNLDGIVNSVSFVGSSPGVLSHPFSTSNLSSGRILQYDGDTDINLTINDLSSETTVVQRGTGKITFVSGNQTVVSLDGKTRTKGQYSIAKIIAMVDQAIVTGDLEAV